MPLSQGKSQQQTVTCHTAEKANAPVSVGGETQRATPSGSLIAYLLLTCLHLSTMSIKKLPSFHKLRPLNKSTISAGSPLNELTSSDSGGQTGGAQLMVGGLCYFFRVILMMLFFSSVLTVETGSVSAGLRVSCTAVWICDVHLKIFIRKVGGNRPDQCI